GGWVFVVEPELHLGPHVDVPAIAGGRRERVTEPADKAYFELAADGVCAAISPRTGKHDQGPKRRDYATYNVGHLGRAEPRDHSLSVFVRQNRNWLLTHTCFDDEQVPAQPLEALTFSLGLIWPFDSPSTDATSEPTT